MTTEISKRALTAGLTAGLGAGALALLAQTQRAAADTPFSAFAFQATGAPTARTMPDRLAEIKNVKDFGAVGDGAKDDTAAIQAAINWTSGGDRGIIFFPAGTYRISSPLTFNYIGPHSIIFRGVGRGSKISGNFAGFLLDRSITNNGDPSIDLIESLWLENGSSNSAAGCIRWNSTGCLTIRGCLINGYTGIGVYDSVFSSSIENIHMSNNGSGNVLPGSIGIFFLGGGGCDISSCDIIGFGDGVRLATGANIRACRFELCGNGLNLGTDSNGNPYGLAAAIVSGCGFEACDVGIWARAINNSFISCCQVNGHAAAFYSGFGAGGNGSGANGWSTYGVVAHNGSTNVWMNITVQGDNQTVSYNKAAIQINDGAQSNNIWMGAEARNGGASPTRSTTTWNIGGENTNGLTFIKCIPEVIPLLPVTSFANLPSTPRLGMTFTITDGPSLAAGVSVTSGGGSNKMLLWHNGTNWVRAV